MKRLLLITLVVMAFVLVGILRSGYIPEERSGDLSREYAYPGNVPEKIPGVIFDAGGFAPIIR